MSIVCEKIVDRLNNLAPKYLAEDWDNIGLLIGDSNSTINRVLISLDATDSVVDEAVNKNVDMIITHHPMIFKGVKHINSSTVIGHKIMKLIKNNISLYTAHTNLDVANQGVSDALADKLELPNAEILKEHPYEEVSNDIFREEISSNIMGTGRIGDLIKEISLGDYATYVKNKLKLSHVRVIGDLDKKIKKVALGPGSSMDFVYDAVKASADVFVTGDIKYHDAIEIKEMGMALIDAGHFGTENIILPVLEKYLRKYFGNNIEIIQSIVNKDPYVIV